MGYLDRDGADLLVDAILGDGKELFDRVVSVISQKYDPEAIFTEERLAEWANDNGYVKAVLSKDLTCENCVNSYYVDGTCLHDEKVHGDICERFVLDKDSLEGEK